MGASKDIIFGSSDDALDIVVGSNNADGASNSVIVELLMDNEGHL